MIVYLRYMYDDNIETSSQNLISLLFVCVKFNLQFVCDDTHKKKNGIFQTEMTLFRQCWLMAATHSKMNFKLQIIKITTSIDNSTKHKAISG